MSDLNLLGEIIFIGFFFFEIGKQYGRHNQ